jgi:hypothetical protein
VTQILQAHLGTGPQIDLQVPHYTDAFDDPAPGMVKQLKVTYRYNGKTGEATFAEGEPIDLPAPK